MIAFVNDSLLLVLVGIINFSGAILLAHIRIQDEALPLPPLPLPSHHTQAEGARG